MKSMQKIKKMFFKWVPLITILLAVIACGGGGSGVGVAGTGGIGGSGVTGGAGNGEITGFGSVIFDNNTFQINSTTQFSIDGVDVSGQSDLGVGMIATFEIADDASANLTTGTAQRIDAVTAIKGQVTSVSPLAVLGQTLLVTGDTILVDVPGNNINNLTLNDLVEVYGIVDTNNVVRATRIEYKTISGLVEWKLTGIVSNVTATSLSVGAQQVNINGVPINDCIGGLNNGDFVEIKADHNSGFTAGGTLNLVSEVECQLRSISVPNNLSANIIPAQFGGVVSGYTGVGDSTFLLGDQLVRLNSATVFRSGTIDDFVNGVRVEVEGSFDTVSRTLEANEIKFKQSRIRMEAPVNVIDVSAGVSLNIMGLTVFGLASTEDDDNILSAASGLPAQVEVRGFVDSSGTIYAERIRERGNVDTSDVQLRGPIDNVNNPNVTILGISVDVSGAAGYFDLQGNALSDINALFNLISAGDILDVEDAQLNAGPTITMDADSTVSIED